jgi:hypothetical protein
MNEAGATVGKYQLSHDILNPDCTISLPSDGLKHAVALAALDAAAQAQQASLVTTTAPVNRLAAIDDFVNTGGCWWGFNPLGMATGALG